MGIGCVSAQGSYLPDRDISIDGEKRLADAMLQSAIMDLYSPGASRHPKPEEAPLNRKSAVSFLFSDQGSLDLWCGLLDINKNAFRSHLPQPRNRLRAIHLVSKLCAGSEKSQKRKSHRKEQIIKILRERGALTFPEICEIGGLGYGYCVQLFRQMKRDGTVVLAGRRGTLRGEADVWKLAG